MKLLAIDPGSSSSAFVWYERGKILDAGKIDNEVMIAKLLQLHGGERVVIEMIASYGMAVGKEVFETVVWIGRFLERSLTRGATVTRMERRAVKLHHCGHARATDSNIRQALIDRYGPSKEAAIGTKKAPGPLYGIKADVWAALALAITFAEQPVPARRTPIEDIQDIPGREAPREGAST